MDDHLFFCGIKHSGKSTLGHLFAQELGLGWADLDDLVLQQVPYPSIRSFYHERGKDAFMQEEVKALTSFLRNCASRTVISLGGGAADNQMLIDLAKANGKLIYLVVPEEVLYQRIMRGGIPPFLDASDPRSSFSTLYAKRHERYGNICDFMIELPNYPDLHDTARFLVETLRNEV
jgi:shikimate kinase